MPTTKMAVTARTMKTAGKLMMAPVACRCWFVSFQTNGACVHVCGSSWPVTFLKNAHT